MQHKLPTTAYALLPVARMQGLTALQALTALTHLRFEEAMLDEEAVSTLATLTQLKHLEISTMIMDRRILTDAEVMHLTKLTGLTKLVLIGFSEVEAEFVNKVGCECEISALTLHMIESQFPAAESHPTVVMIIASVLQVCNSHSVWSAAC